MDREEITKAVKSLSDVYPEYNDIFDLLGILVDDFSDMYKATDKRQFLNQKKDCRITLKYITRKLKNLTFKNRTRR